MSDGFFLQLYEEMGQTDYYPSCNQCKEALEIIVKWWDVNIGKGVTNCQW